MKQISVFLCVYIITVMCSWTCSQTMYSDKEFEEFAGLFYELKLPYNYLYDEEDFPIPKVSKSQSKKYLALQDSDLVYNDEEFDIETGERFDNWQECIPGAIGKISNTNWVALIYGQIKQYSGGRGLDYYIAVLNVFSYDGKLLNKMTIRKQETWDEDNLEVVFINKNKFRLFDYQYNSDAVVTVKDSWGIERKKVDKNKPRTVCSIVEYEITDEGEIRKTGWKEERLLKGEVFEYREADSESDNPILEYK